MSRCRWRVWSSAALLLVGWLCAFAPRAHAQAADVVLYASDVSTIQGNWSRVAATGTAGGQQMASADRGWSTTSTALANPADYFEANFTAPTSTTYHVWLRLRATGDSKWNESVWVQFSDSTTTSGAATYRIGTANALLVNLEPCSGCGVASWGWQDKAYWLSQSALVQFSAGSNHTIRVQTREDGVQLDQIVLSPSNYYSGAPGQGRGDLTIVPKSGAPPPPPPPPPQPTGSTPYLGSPVSLPGLVQAENFDNGGEGVAYHDLTPPNYGNVYRSTGVDLEWNSAGGVNVGWADAGEWLNYGVNVASAGSYTVNFRVASAVTGGSFHLDMNGSNVTGTLSVPYTGGWQNWQIVTRVVALTAGMQTARLVVDSAGGNYDYLDFVGSTPPVGSAPGAPYSPNVPPGTIGVTVTPTLSWQAASGATSYELRVGTSNPPPTYVASMTATWYGVSQLLAGTQYYWQVIAKNSSGSTAGPVWNFSTAGGAPPPPPPPPTGGTLRMMTWNIHSGTDVSNVYVLPQQVQFMAAQNADVIVLQEVNIWNQDQPAIIHNLLQQNTGRTWYRSWAPSCASGGCLGNLILSRIPITSSSMIFSTPTAFGRAEINVAGVPIQIFSSHLDYYNTSLRTQELYNLMQWARSFSGPRLVGGDFNSWWGEWWILQMSTEYSDTWQAVTGSNQNGYTVGNVRFDYIFRSYDGSNRVTPTNVYVAGTSLSDHRPVVADFRVQ